MVMLLPGLGEAQIPATVKLGASLCLVALVLPALGPLAPPPPLSLARMVGAEILTGACLGWVASCAVQALSSAGQVLALMTGLSNVLAPDPAVGQSTVLTRLLGAAAPAVFLGSGLWRLPVSALAGSYTLVPTGHLLPALDTAEMVIGSLAELFAVAIQLAAPLIVAGTAWHIALALLARLVPQLQVFSLAVPGQILGGLLLLALLGGGLMTTWMDATQAQLEQLPGLR